MPMNPELLLSHQDFVRVLARRLVADYHHAEDVAQETWLKVLRRGEEPTRTPRTWLARIVRNAAHDERRYEASARRREEARLEAAIPTTADVVEREAVRKEIVDAVLGLREPYRTAILLRFYELLPPRAIASRLGEPVETVRTRVKRGIEMLRSALGIVPGRPRRSRGLLALARPLSKGLATRVFATGVAMKTSSKVMLAAALLLFVGVVAPFLLPSGGGPSRPLSASSAPDEVREPAATTAQGPEAAHSSDDRDESAPAFAPIRGKVVDERGAAVPGARIIAHIVQMDVRFTDVPPPDRAAAPVSRADGSFEVPVATERATRRLFVEADGFSPNTVDAVAGEPLTIVLEKTRAIVGTVRDAAERPIAGARVRVAGLIGPVRVEREATSSANGTFRVEGIPTERIRRVERSWCIIASASGFAPLLTPLDDLARSTAGREIGFDPYLVRGASVRGRVVDAETGVPIAGAGVFLWSAEGKEYPLGEMGSPNPWCPRLLERVRSDAQGTFRFDHVPAEGPLPIAACVSCNQGMVAAMVGVVAPAYAPAQGNVVVSPDGADLEVEIRCWPAVAIRGRVVGEDGLPKSGVNVAASAGGRWSPQLPAFCEGAESCRSVTDQQGLYVVRGIAAAKADSDATVTASLSPFGQAKAPVTLKAGETAIAPDLVFPATHAPVVQVRVTDERGTPVAGARVRMDCSGVSQARPDTDARGENQFVFREEAAGVRNVRALVQAAGFAPATSEPFTPVRDQALTVTVALDHGHRLTGRARWRNGDPAKSIVVYALDPSLAPEAVFPQLYGSDSSSRTPAEYAFGITQADGSFEMRIRPGTAQRLLGPKSPSGQPTTLLVPADAQDVTLVIQDDAPAADEGAIVEGTVVERESSRLIMGFTAEIVVNKQWFKAQRIGPGRFRASGLPEGTGQLRVAPEGFPPVEQEVAVTAGRTATVKVMVAGGVTVRGRVIAASDVNLEGTILSLKPETGRHEVIARVRADGSYDAVGLAPGRYTISVVVWESQRNPQFDFALRGSAEVEVTQAPEQTHDITIERGTRLAVYVRSGEILKLLRAVPNLSLKERATLDQTRIEIRDASGRLVRSSKGFAESSWVLTNGAYEVMLSPPGGAVLRQRVVLDGHEPVYASFDPD